MWPDNLFSHKKTETKPVVAVKTVAKPKTKERKWPWVLLIIAILIPFGLATWISINPSVMDSHNKAKASEMNFQTALVQTAQANASLVPKTVTVSYKTPDGAVLKHNVVVYAYGADTSGGKYALYFKTTDDPTKILARKAYIAPVKIATVEKSWVKETVASVSKWSIWAKIWDYSNTLSALGSP